MLRSESRILTTHTGSLPRPPHLTALYAMRERGATVDPEEIEAAGQKALAEIVPRQIAAGIDIGNDGEQTREAFFLYVRRRMSGFGGGWDRPAFADVSKYPSFRAWKAAHDAVGEAVSNTGRLPEAVGEVRYQDAAPIEAECRAFRAVLDALGGGFAEAFLTAPSPGIVAAALRNAHYATDAAYIVALGEALRVEYETIVRHGFLLQIDAPDLALERHASYQGRPIGDFLRFVARVVETINRALENVPRERVRLHACWGNYEGPHDCDVPLAEILPSILEAKAGAFVLPFANPRHAHEYRCLEALKGADGPIVVGGVIDVLTNFVEHPEVVAERIERIAAAVGDPRRVIAGTDCGFDTSAGRGRVAEDVVWAKLAALAEGARIASGRLFGGQT